MDPHGSAYYRPAMEFDAGFYREAGWARVRVRGEIDMDNAGHLEHVLRGADTGDHAGVAIDLTYVDLLSAAGLRALSGCRRRLGGRDRGFVLLDPKPFIEQVLRVGGLADATLTATLLGCR
ncbi:STAS domain-containing protein [Actinoplanes sp. Pm04-4]|uniref:STAS domain-containing protein n=1 Tax=Paractinoplanes pyxinae TaxID=2997416 RepID=A0ABT4BB35_9ACTN|nr:STAS domain-containing protein [Actinoplanes pyxinae]MCY1143736.1 STAS domain-containing protein [Actinoplanes pyxinae]